MLLRRTVMKFVKKILMVVLVASVFVCGIALSSSAQAPNKTPEYYENVFEFGGTTYINEDYESFVQDTAFVGNVAPDVVFYGNAVVDTDSENKHLKISVLDDANYYRWNSDVDMPVSVISSFKIKLGDVGSNNGAQVVFNVTMHDYFENVPVLKLDALDASTANIKYLSFDERNVEYIENVSEAALVIGTWYTVDVLFNADDGNFYFAVSDGDDVIATANVPANESAGIDSVMISVNNGEKATESITYIDDFCLYEGKVFRNIDNNDVALAEFIVEMNEYANDASRTVDERLAMADLYNRFFPGYTPELSLPNYDDVVAIKANAEAYGNKALAYAFINHSFNIMKQTTCYDKFDYQQEVAKPFYDLFQAADINAIDGMDEIFEEGITYGEKVLAAKNEYDFATREIETIKVRSAAFVYQLEIGYNPNSLDYNHMIEQRDALAAFVSKVDPAYKYTEESLGDPASEYETAGDALSVYAVLVSKIADIESAVANFVPKVAALSKIEADSLSKDNPYLTVNFTELYANYNEVKNLCKGGVVHPLLDSNTYPGLIEVIAVFEEYKVYVESREAACMDFVSLVNGAANVGLYHTAVAQLDEAAKYLDNNKEYSLEKHIGVEDAIKLYDSLRAKLAVDFKNATDYKTAVSAINLQASYADLLAQVQTASNLKDAGAIVGIDGINEANLALIEAEKKLDVYKSFSESLISNVEKLKTATTIAERRTLIFNANAVKDKAQDAISGVTAAKTELAAQIEKYNSDVAAANAVFAGVVTDVATVSAASCPTTGLYKMLDVIKAFFK